LDDQLFERADDDIDDLTRLLVGSMAGFIIPPCLRQRFQRSGIGSLEGNLGPRPASNLLETQGPLELGAEWLIGQLHLKAADDGVAFFPGVADSHSAGDFAQYDRVPRSIDPWQPDGQSTESEGGRF
jgi:hypothetical protein